MRSTPRGPAGLRERCWQLVRATLVSFSLAAGACAPAPPPSALVIVVDTLRADRLGCYGHARDTSRQLEHGVVANLAIGVGQGQHHDLARAIDANQRSARELDLDALVAAGAQAVARQDRRVDVRAVESEVGLPGLGALDGEPVLVSADAAEVAGGIAVGLGGVLRLGQAQAGHQQRKAPGQQPAN